MPQTGFRQQHSAAEVAVFELVEQILIGQQPRDRDRMAVKIIEHGDDLAVYLREFRFQIAHHFVEERRRGAARRNR